jgi:4-amino-4-deoxy-L-arabinose transferase-like glycosyltransferase
MVFVGWRSQGFVAVSADPYGYVAMAQSLLHGHGFATYGSVLNRRGPLYPALIAFVYLVTGEHPVVMKLVQALMLAGICALAYEIGRLLYNPRTGLIAGALCALHPALLRYVSDFHVETLLAFLATLSLWRSVLLLEKPTIRNGALFGVFAALGALAKPVLLVYPAVFVAWWALRERGSGLRRAAAPGGRAPFRPWVVTRWPAVAAIFVAMGVVILPWTYRNYRSSGHPVLITTGFGDAFLRGYIFSKADFALLRLPPYTYAEQESNATFEALCQQAGTVWQRNDVESDRILTAASARKLRAEPGEFARKFIVQLFTFWYEMTNLANSLLVGLSAVILWVLALVGWRRARKEGYISWPLFLPILCLNIALAVLLALGRYSVPVVPALAVLAAFGVDTLLSTRWPSPGRSALRP